ncbi:hypothetical protein NDU88_006657 [Pleurodeles waltl]|uniref:Uncharacterized protein n=1 Tax=Pleurodeles waltl TaxID=8319 RepID=A0AAV7WE85_PLEWA|nr:hypothetical protein NDU88_006657 [Pleurodeles waltl]
MGVIRPVGNSNRRRIEEGEDRGTEWTKNKEQEQTGDGETAVCGGGSGTESRGGGKLEEDGVTGVQSTEEGEDAQKPATF